MLDPRWFNLDPLTVTERFDLPSKYLTYPSQLWAHKNHRTVLAALNLLRDRGRTDVVLVCTGREYDFRRPDYADGLKKEIVRRGLQSQVRLLGLLDRATQIQVMRTSAAVIQASFFEGREGVERTDRRRARAWQTRLRVGHPGPPRTESG